MPTLITQWVLQVISPARGPALWDDGGDAQVGDRARIETDWDQAAPPVPDFDALPSKLARSTVNDPVIRHILVVARPGIALETPIRDPYPSKFQR
jgi:hypothetical protein